jgi:hypothetical protein
MGFRIDWTEEARGDVRALDRAAIRIFEGLQRYAIGSIIRILAVKNRKESYR